MQNGSELLIAKLVLFLMLVVFSHATKCSLNFMSCLPQPWRSSLWWSFQLLIFSWWIILGGVKTIAKGLTTAQVDIPCWLVLLAVQLPQHGAQLGWAARVSAELLRLIWVVFGFHRAPCHQEWKFQLTALAIINRNSNSISEIILSDQK